jgi:peroxiredoxin-like protein
MEPHIYNVDLKWKNNRLGELSSPELNDHLDVATPPQFPKGIDGVWSPEHLFTAAISSCLMTTFLSIAENSKLEFLEFSCSAKGKLELIDSKMRMTEVLLEPVIVLKDENDREKAERVIQKSENACLISNSVNAKVILQQKIYIGQWEPLTK